MTTATITEKPILFSGPMVRAILEGRKTQTRRVAKFKPLAEGLNVGFSGLDPDDQGPRGWVLSSRGAGGVWNERTHPLQCPYGRPDERLWVREAWASVRLPGADMAKPQIIYREGTENAEAISWKPSIHMRRWASRITLEVTKVRVERIQSMSFNDWKADFFPSLHEQELALRTFVGDENRRKMSAERWDKIYLADGHGWDSNPWVWVIEFKRVQA